MTSEDLKNYRHSKNYIKTIMEELEADFESITNTTTKLTGLPKGNNKPNYSLEEYIDKSNEVAEELKKTKIKLKSIVHQLNKLKPIYQDVLALRYIKGLSAEETATELHYTYNYIGNITNEGMKEFNQYDEDVKKS